MDIKKLVMDLIEKGMSDEQIVSKIKDHEELKSKSADQIFAVLAEAKRDADLSREFASRKAAELKEKSEKEIERVKTQSFRWYSRSKKLQSPHWQV